MSYVSTREQTSLNHPLPRLLKVEISHWHIPASSRRLCIAPKKTSIAQLQAPNMKKCSGTTIIKMLSSFSLTSSPTFSRNHSCSALLQGRTNSPEPGWGPALQGFGRKSQRVFVLTWCEEAGVRPRVFVCEGCGFYLQNSRSQTRAPQAGGW